MNKTKELFKKYKSGDIAIRNEIFNENVKLVSYFVQKTYGKNDNDLFQEGCLGLLKAIDTFDYKKGYSFSTYAYRCIRNQVFMLGRKSMKYQTDISINTPLKTEDYNLTIQDTIKDDKIIPPIKNIIEQDQMQKILNIIKTLSKKEQRIIKLYFMIGSNEKYTQKEIGKMYDHSQTYVNRIIKKCLSDIREQIKEQEVLNEE